VFKDSVAVNGESVKIHDIMNPSGMFKNGERQQEYSAKCLLPLSGRLIPEFDKRRSIKDMFSRKPAGSRQKASSRTVERPSTTQESETPTPPKDGASETLTSSSVPASQSQTAAEGVTRKRTQSSGPPPSMPVKRSKSAAQAPAASAPGQQTLKGFFKPKSFGHESPKHSPTKNAEHATLPPEQTKSPSKIGTPLECNLAEDHQLGPGAQGSADEASQSAAGTPTPSQESETVIDPVASKQDWSKLFSKKSPPKCESHEEHCISLTTKKPGINCGRAFWICPRPLGPSGNKEKGTQWRCATFIWASDWNPTT
jgi:AP endonuclease-2